MKRSVLWRVGWSVALMHGAGVALAAMAGAPAVSTVTALSARPALLASGNSGPINRYGFDVLNFAPADPAARVLCIYPRALVYRCGHEFSPDARGGARRRVIVEVADLDRGTQIVVRFINARGSTDARVELANSPRLIHEIEALTLRQGGATITGADGSPAVASQLTSERAETIPAIATSSLRATVECDQIYAQWIGASATDPVFSSAFGALDGSVVLARPVKAGTRVSADNLPEWLVTYPLSATRVQFIAHYEVIHRVAVCPDKVVAN